MQEKRNIVFVGFTATQEKLIKEDNYYKVNRFPKFIFVDTLEDALKHQGFMMIIKNPMVLNMLILLRLDQDTLNIKPVIL